MRFSLLAAIAFVSISTPALAAPVATTTGALLPVKIDKAEGKILVTLPPPAADGVSGRFLYATSLRTGLGSAPAVLDRGRVGETRILAFRRLGKKVAIQFENPRFRAGGTNPASADFAVSTVWLADVVSATPDGGVTIDLSGFLAADVLGIAAALGPDSDPLGVGKRANADEKFKIEDKLSAADTNSVKVFPDNIEIDAVQTYVSEKPGEEVRNILPDPRRVSFTVHHSFVALPGPGFVSKPFDVRIGGFPTQTLDFGVPLGSDVVRDVANRFRLEKTNPAAARSKVKTPIVFYVDRNAPEPIRAALIEGINWWGKAFDAAGYIDAFRAELLPEGVDPLDARYNVVNWVDRATRGWSYGQEIVDPRTGEIVKGMVVLGSLRARQDIEIFKGLVGAAETNSGGPNDPVRVALARLRQLAAHEVGHALGFAHNFAASTEDRASVMDYPAPRVTLVDGRPDLSDAYGVGVGRWDMATVAWLYGDTAAADPTNGLRYVPDDNARAPDTAQPWGGLWDDGPDPIVELTRLMRVRQAAIAGFGLTALSPGEPVANLRRRFVPVWLLHRYEVNAAAKSIGGVAFVYSVNGGGHEGGAPVTSDRQRTALDALLATLSPDALRVPDRLLPLLSAARNGSDNRQYDIETFQTAGGPVFDPLVAADVAAEVTLGTLLAPTRLQRLVVQNAADPQALSLDELLDRLDTIAIPDRGDALSRRIAYRTIVTLAQVASRPGTTPEVATTLDARVEQIAARLAKRSGDGGWGASLSRQLLDPREREALLADHPRVSTVPPGEPIGGGGEDDWMALP